VDRDDVRPIAAALTRLARRRSRRRLERRSGSPGVTARDPGGGDLRRARAGPVRAGEGPCALARGSPAPCPA